MEDMEISFKNVKKYCEELCSICVEFERGPFIILHGKHICQNCIDKLSKSKKIIDIMEEN